MIFNGNWITYLDGMLQLNMLNEELVGLTVPVEIEKIVIDVDTHKEFISKELSKTKVTETGLSIFTCT